MDYSCGASAEDWNVVHLSPALGHTERSLHKCGFSCQVEHVWANLYVCKSTGNAHVCDKNCDQRITYDNHSSICRASGQIFPLHGQAVHGARRKRDFEVYDSHDMKRNWDFPRPGTSFGRSMQMNCTHAQCGEAMEIV